MDPFPAPWPPRFTDSLALEAIQWSRAAPPPVTWRVHPLRDESPLRSAALLGLIAGFSALAAVSLGDALFGLLSLLVLSGATVRYLLPTDYRVDADGIAVRQLVWRRRPWSAMRRVERHRDGIFLSPFVQPSRLDSFRGLFVPFAAGLDAAAVTDLAQAQVQAQSRIQTPTQARGAS